ncbi:MAG: hypothetical protein ACTHN5_02565 [Phycisphaerae bacterium]
MRMKSGMLALMLWAGVARAEEGGGYPILFERASAVGNVYEIHDVYDLALTQTVASPTHDPVETKTTKHVDFTAQVKVKEVSERGEVTDMVLKVNRMVRADGRDMIRPGSVIRMKTGTENHVEECSTGPVPDAAMAMINRFIPPRGTSGKTMDDLFGSKVPRRMNDTWGIDREAASERLAGQGIAVNAEEISGKTTVNGLRVDGLMVTTEMTVPNMTLPIPMPREVKLDLCSVKGVARYLLPVDPRGEISDVTMTMDSMASGHRTDTMMGLEVRAHEVMTVHAAIVRRGKPEAGPRNER